MATQTGKPSWLARLQDKPFPPNARYLLEWFYSLNSCRSYAVSMAGAFPQRVSFRQLLDFAELFDIEFARFEIALLTGMDDAWLAAWHDNERQKNG